MRRDIKTISTVDPNSRAIPTPENRNAVKAELNTACAAETRPAPTSEELLHVSRLVTVGELAACFAHEVFQPLMMIRGHLLFADQNLEPDHPVRMNLETIQRAERRIEEMARRMLDFSKKRPGQFEFCDVAELLSDALRFVQPYFLDQFIDCRITIGPGLPKIRVDYWQIVQAIVSLLQNAADAMRNRDRRSMTILVDQDGTDLRIAIADTGPGIAVADLPHIFEPFFTTKGERGTGLGLFIARRIVDEHHGSITAQSTDRGTTFFVRLPLYP